MAAPVGGLRVDLSANIAAFKRDMGKARAEVRKTTKGFGGLKGGIGKTLPGLKALGAGLAIVGVAAAAAAGGIFLLTKRFAEQGDKLAKTSKALGIGVEQLQRWQFAAERSGGNADKFVKGLIKLRVELERVATGDTSEAAGAFERLGINIKDTTTGSILPLEQLLPQVADKFKNMTNEQEKASLAALIFGTRIGAQLVPLLNEGSEGIAKLGAEADKYGLISAKSAKLSEGFVDAQRNLSQAFTGVKSVIGEKLLPIFTEMIQKLTDWIAENRELIAQDVAGAFKEIKSIAEKLVDPLKAIGKQIGFIVEGTNLLLGAFESTQKVIARQGLSDELRPLVERFNEVNDRIKTLSKLSRSGFISNAAQKELVSLRKEARSLTTQIADLKNKERDTKKQTDLMREAFGDLEDEFLRVGGDGKGGAGGLTKAAKQLNASLAKQILTLKKQVETFGFSEAELINYDEALLLVRASTAKGGKETETLIKQISRLRRALAMKKVLKDLRDGLKKTTDTFSVSVEELRQDTSGLTKIFNADVIRPLAEAPSFISKIGDAFTDLTSSGQTSAQILADAFTEAGRRISDTFQTIIQNLISGNGFSLKTLTQGIGSAFSSLGAGISTAVGIEKGGVLGGVIGAGGGFFSGIIGGLIGSLGSLFKKKPRLDIEIPSFGGNADEFAQAVSDGLNVSVQDFLDAVSNKALQESLIFVKEKHGDTVDSQKIRQTISDIIATTIGGVQDLIGSLPGDIAQPLLDELKNTDLQLFQTIDDFLLEFDEKGKNLKDKVALFLKELGTIRFPAAIRSIFVDTLQAAGVDAQKAAEFVQRGLVDPLKNISSREGRIAAGQQFLDNFKSFVDAFNLINSEAQGQLTKAVERAKSLSTELGFVGIPTLDQFKASLQTLIKEAELDPSVVAKYKELRDILIQTRQALAQSVSSLVSIITRTGAQTGNVPGIATSALTQAAGSLRNLLQQGGLSLAERENVLGQLASITEQLATAEQQQAAKALEAQKQIIETRITGLESERDLITQNFKTRIDALNEELSVAQEFKDLSEQIGSDLRGIIFGADSPLTGIEKFSRLQGDIAGAMGATTAAEIDRLRGFLTQSFQIGTEAFGAGSPEQLAIFQQVTTELQSLQDTTAERGRMVEEINAEIERLTAINSQQLADLNTQIETLRSQTQTQTDLTDQISQSTRDLFNFIQGEAVSVLEERLTQLNEFGNTQVEQNSALMQLQQDGLTKQDKQIDLLQLIELNTRQGLTNTQSILQSVRRGELGRVIRQTVTGR